MSTSTPVAAFTAVTEIETTPVPETEIWKKATESARFLHERIISLQGEGGKLLGWDHQRTLLEPHYVVLRQIYEAAAKQVVRQTLKAVAKTESKEVAESLLEAMRKI